MEVKQFGLHTLICGDSYEVMSTLQYDTIITDPPYELVATGGGIGAKRQYLSDIDDNIDSGFDYKIFDGCKNWMSFGSKTQIVPLIQKAELMGLRWQLLTWNKPNPTPLTNGNYLPDTEYIIHGFDKLPDVGYHNKRKYKVFPIEKNKFDHPSVKPLAICEWLIKSSTIENNVVCDPFMGTGSTGISCIDTKRIFIGIEMNKKYFKIACQRFEKHLNKPKMDSFFE